MSIPFTCPHCGGATQVDDQYAGQTGPCASCGAAVTIPIMATSAPLGRSKACLTALIVVVILVPLLFCGGVIGLGLIASNRIEPMRKAAFVDAARAQIAGFETPLESYNLHVGDYPTTEQGLDALMQCPADLPDPDAWRGPYLAKEIPLDPWRNPYQYVYPGVDDLNGAPDLWSMGPDGISGTEDDIAGWEEELQLR